MLSVLSIGCADLTRITNDSATQPQQLDNAQGALVRRAGAIRDFASAYSLQILYSGILTDELWSANVIYEPDDRRMITVSNQSTQSGGFPYPALSAARLESLRALGTMQTYLPTRKAQIGELYALAGYVETFFAEDLCSGVPVGTLVHGTPALGPTLTRSQVLQAALTHFDSASLYAIDSGGARDTIIANLAAVGRGRVLLDSGDFAGAAGAVATVPVSFKYSIDYGNNVPSTQVNSTAAQLQALVISIADLEGANGIGFVSGRDPRLPVDSTTSTAIYGRPVYAPASYTQAMPVVLSSGIEARLLVAEALLSSGNIGAWTDTLNALRAQALTPIAPLTADSTTVASGALRLAVQFRERAFWLFLTGHRQGDLRRLARRYGLSADTVFPTGLYAGGGSYGHDVTFVPYFENGNPNYHGCLDRSP